jgi:sigma-B regulation protein RsbU (phosphoserine phosphatase)
MNAPQVKASSNGLTDHGIVVLLVDDQPIIAEAVRRMLADQPDVTLHYCQDPTQALETANQVHPTVILQDLVMPDVDGLMLVKFFRVNPATRETPMIVLSSKEEPVIKAQAFARGASDYLVKLPDKVELVARIRHHSRGYISLLERNEAYEALDRSRAVLAEQIDAASRYLRSLLPFPATKPVMLDWRYIPSADLGGDTFGYDWLDGDHLAMYILDVTGHGLDSALFAVTIMNVLRSRSLPDADFRQPGQVLARLNDAFPMEQYGQKNFTIWYGVFVKPENKLRWSGGGHPEGIVIEPGGATKLLKSEGPLMGMMPWPEWETSEMTVEAGSRMYVYTDGVHEIHKVDGGEWTFDELVAFLSKPPDGDGSIMDHLHRHVCELHGSDMLDDDFSIIEACF